MMKRLIALAVAAGALALAGCDEPRTDSDEVAPPPAEPPVASAAADTAVPAAATAAPDRRPADSSTLPAEKRTSEETVHPDSDTLFY